jgi:hypothetical protein
LSDDEDNSKNEPDSNSNLNNNNDDDEFTNSSASSFPNFGTSTTHLLKKGQELLKQKNKNALSTTPQKKRNLDDEETHSFSNRILSTKSITTTTTTTTTANFSQAEASLGVNPSIGSILKKFSFLNRDKNYMNRLSNYVNKNLSHGSTINANKPICRSNNMVFTSIHSSDTTNPDANTNIEQDENEITPKLSANIVKNQPKKNETISNAVPEAKRPKYDPCESIFNHINY